MKLRTTSFSKSRDSMGVTDMGRKSEQVAGRGILATGVITLVFYCSGTTDQDNERLNSVVSGLDSSGAATLKNQDGRPSFPAAVGIRWSRRWKICISVRKASGCVAVLFNVGASYLLLLQLTEGSPIQCPSTQLITWVCPVTIHVTTEVSSCRLTIEFDVTLTSAHPNTEII